jgi:hypothetical protein
MAYRKSLKHSPRSLDELAGHEQYCDSVGRTWVIRVYPLGGLSKLTWAMGKVAESNGAIPQQVQFIASMLLDPEPDWGVRVRRLLGLPDYSPKMIGRLFFAKDVVGVTNAICKANLDMTFDELVERAKKNEEDEKKKIE